MSKKKRKSQRAKAEELRKQYGIDPTDEQSKQKAVLRLAQMMQALGAAPEPILTLFDRLELPYEVIDNSVDSEQYKTIVIKLSDLEAAEERNQAQGSMLKRMYPSPSTSEQVTANQQVQSMRGRLAEFRSSFAEKPKPAVNADAWPRMDSKIEPVDPNEVNTYLKGMRG